MSSDKIGGMYALLPKIIEYLNNVEKVRFTCKELMDISEMSKQSIINQVSNLVSASFLVKHEFRLPNKPGKHVEYSISPYAVDIIKEVLY